VKGKHFKKMIAPIIVCVCLILYYVALAYIFITQGYKEFSPVSIAFGIIIPLLIGGITLFVTIQRIDEIKGGEEDDISKY